MFLGEFTHTIDEKGRLTVPARFRAGLTEGLVITRGIDRCLVIYPLEEWERLAEKVSALPVTERNARAFRRLMFANASDVVPDGQGRILIPPRLREYANLDGEAVVTGLDRFVEIWDPDLWNEERRRVEEYDAELDEWAALGI